jgi:hypothetical protein
MEFITGKAISRREVLRGLGTMLALPMLDSMVPASVYGRTKVLPVRRFQGVYVPNGAAMEFWTPTRQGSNFVASQTMEEALQLTPILEPLAPFQDSVIQLSGVHASWVQAHAGASGSWLTGVPQGGSNETEVVADVSMDQLLAREFSSETQLASLELAMDSVAQAGSCSASLSCAYLQGLSWRGRTQPLPAESNPRVVFERLFGDSGSTERSVRQARLQQQKSILDSVMDELAALNRRIGPQDNLKLEQYTEAIRDVERRIQKAEEQIDFDLPAMIQPEGAPSDYEEHLELMLDLQLLAFQTDLTRVITFMYAHEQSSRPYPQIGVPQAHHPLSHHGNEPGAVATMAKINRYHVEMFSRYVAKLQATPDGDGSLLDNMVILYGSGLSNSTFHAGDNLPLLLVGGGGGRLRGGRHLTYSGEPSMANLLVTLMDKLGVPVNSLGASTGRLPLETLTGV